MAFRFFKRIKVLPGITLNLSKSGGSLSVGPRGAKITIGPKGIRRSVGIPGTGLYHTTHTSYKSSASSRPKYEPAVPSRQDRLTLGFFKRLLTPDDEKTLVDGLKELSIGNISAAFEQFKKASHLTDGAFLAGILSLKNESFQESATYLQYALSNLNNLGMYFNKYGVSARVSIPVTEGISATIEPDERGIRLALAEAYQGMNDLERAIDNLKILLDLDPFDTAIIKLSMAELLFESGLKDKTRMQEIIDLAGTVKNESDMHATLMLYKARALRKLNLPAASKELLSEALRKKSGRSEDILKALRYERALAYEDMGQGKRARTEFEKLYAEDSNYEDLKVRLK